MDKNMFAMNKLNLYLYRKSDFTGLYTHLTGVPKALLPGVGGKKILDFWWETVNT